MRGSTWPITGRDAVSVAPAPAGGPCTSRAHSKPRAKSMSLPIHVPSIRARTLSCLALGICLLPALGCSTNSNPAAPVMLPPLSRVVISLASDTTVTADTLQIAQSHTFAATVRDTGNAIVNTTVGWSSTNLNVFTVSSSGVAVGHGEGGAWLIAAVADKRDSVAILVLPGLTGWVVQTSNSSRRLNGIFMQPDGANGVVVGDGGEILTTADAGVHWTRRVSSTSFNLNAVWFATPDTGWAVGNGGTEVRTTKGGTSWKSTPSGFSDNLFDVTFATPDTGWAVGSGGSILRTFNGGTSWQKQAPTAGVLNSVSFSDTRHGWAVGDLGVIFGTIDRGLSWTLVSPAVTALSLKGVSTRGTFLARAVGAQGAAPRTFDNTGTEDWELRNAGASNQLEDVMFP